jgi:hypothetical protein
MFRVHRERKLATMQKRTTVPANYVRTARITDEFLWQIAKKVTGSGPMGELESFGCTLLLKLPTPD